MTDLFYRYYQTYIYITCINIHHTDTYITGPGRQGRVQRRRIAGQNQLQHLEGATFLAQPGENPPGCEAGEPFDQHQKFCQDCGLYVPTILLAFLFPYICIYLYNEYVRFIHVHIYMTFCFLCFHFCVGFMLLFFAFSLYLNLCPFVCAVYTVGLAASLDKVKPQTVGTNRYIPPELLDCPEDDGVYNG